MVWPWILALAAVLVVTGTYAWGAWRAAPYVPTVQRDVERMLRLANIQANETVLDLGAGDGRFVVTAAKRFRAKAIGYEISLLPYLFGKIWIAFTPGIHAAMVYKDFFHVNLRPADVVVCFLTPGAMAKLAPKFRQELRPGTRIVSYAFALPGWSPVTKDKPQANIMAAYLYRV